MRILTVAFCSLFACSLWAQTTSTVTGTVEDQQGAVLEGARVVARHTETGLGRSTLTGPDGRFILPAMPVGSYEIRSERKGFQTVVYKGLNLAVGETAVVKLVMQLGPVEQEVTVFGQASMVNTSTSELSYLVSEEAIRDLPLNGRNYTDLALLQPGVVAFPYRDGGSVVAHGLGASMNGQDPRSNVYLLDGTPQNDFTNGPAGSAASTVLGMEMIREFRVETNVYGAEFGRNSGGQITALTKSGTNQMHGSLYEYFRNDNLDTRNFFDPSRKPKFTRNQFGSTVGGPVRKERVFFFTGFEALKERLGKTVIAVVPDENARQGILPGVTSFTVDSAVRPYLNQYPLPNGRNLGNGLANYLFGFPQRLNQYFAQGRLDLNLGSGHQAFARFTFDDADQFLPTDYPQFPRDFVSRNQFLTLEDTWIASPRTLHTFRGNFARTRVGQTVQANVPSALTPFVPGRTMMGGIDIGGIPGRFGPQTSVSVQLVQNVFGFEHGMVHTSGKHILKAGFLAEHYRDNLFNPTFSLGIYSFANLENFLKNRPTSFLGLAPNGALDRYWRFTLFGFYVQENYRASSRLTLNAGLRYEFATLPVDIYGRDSALPNLGASAPAVGKLYQNPTLKNFSPRFGFAWDLFGDGKTSLRGGYGWFFNTNNQQNLIVTITNPPATPRVTIANNPTFTNLTFPVAPFERGIGNSIRPVQWDLKNPNVHFWNLNLQRQMPGEVLLTLGYAGSRGVHLLRSGDVNIATPVRQADGSYFFPPGTPRRNPAWSTIELKSSDGNSWYNALIFEARKRFQHGFRFQSSYTFSRNIDTTQASTFFSDATNDTTSDFPELPGLNNNKGPADYHTKHNWVVNASWDLPFGKKLTGWQHALLEGWQLAGIGQVRSGYPLTVFVQANRSRSQWFPSLGPGLGRDRPNMAPGFTYETAVAGSPSAYFNPLAFQLQPAGYFGNSGRGAFLGPNLRNLDLAAIKTTRLPWGENKLLQFRAEAFNILNHTNFGVPTVLAFAGAADNEKPLGSLGQIRSTVTSSRQIQLGLRITF